MALEIELHDKQLTALYTIANEVLYGGAAGGGKSHLMRQLSIIASILIPGLNTYLFRRLSGDLIKNHLEGSGGYVNLLSKYVIEKKVKINFSKNEIAFSNGSKIFLCHCQHEKDIMKYQGAEIHLLLIDELTHFTEKIYTFLRGRCRLGELHIPNAAKELLGEFPKILAGSNPGSLGHNWVKATFVDYQPYMQITRTPKKDGGMLRQYIPAKLTDNPTLLENDPDYADRLNGLGSPDLVRAMLNGDWDIVAGGALDDVWHRDTHVIEPFNIPYDWYIDRGYDWGSSKPAGCLFFAESNGNQIEISPGVTRTFPRGSIIVFSEIYFWSGKTNEGSKLLAIEHAEQIKERETYIRDTMRVNVRPGCADNAIFDTQNGNCIADDMKKVGIRWEKSDKSPGSRKQGLEKLRELLKNAITNGREKPGIYFFNTCSNTIRTLPTLPRDEKKPDDIDTAAEDHLYDVIRYRITMPKREITSTDFYL
jgi:hypothetical protein